MTTTAIRDRLYDYIRVADDKKIKAIYTMLESEIEDVAWWKDDGFVKKLDAEYNDWKTGKIKGYTTSEVKERIEQLRLKRSVK